MINIEKSLTFLVGTQIPALSSKAGQHLKPLMTLIRKNASNYEWRLLLHKVALESDLKHLPKCK
jgi:hypothetical protein